MHMDAVRDLIVKTRGHWDCNFTLVVNSCVHGLLRSKRELSVTLTRAIVHTFHPLVRGMRGQDLSFKFVFERDTLSLTVTPTNFFTSLLFRGLKDMFVPPSASTLGSRTSIKMAHGSYMWVDGDLHFSTLPSGVSEGPVIQQDGSYRDTLRQLSPSWLLEQPSFVGRYADSDGHLIEFRRIFDPEQREVSMIGLYRGDLFVDAGFVMHPDKLPLVEEDQESSGMPIIRWNNRTYILGHVAVADSSEHKKLLKDIILNLGEISPDLVVNPLPGGS